MTFHHAAASTARFGYAGRWSPSLSDVQTAAYLVNNPNQPTGMVSTPVFVGVEAYSLGTPAAQYRVVTHNEYQQAAQRGTLFSTSA
ncbi:MAG: hypothetical protein QE263_02590 [Vampirovibrionales bacterium]|nr:hypothetical protein [Vampirovibrionales bacterium]